MSAVARQPLFIMCWKLPLGPVSEQASPLAIRVSPSFLHKTIDMLLDPAII
jgi:hypothetical protein